MWSQTEGVNIIHSSARLPGVALCLAQLSKAHTLRPTLRLDYHHRAHWPHPTRSTHPRSCFSSLCTSWEKHEDSSAAKLGQTPQESREKTLVCLESSSDTSRRPGHPTRVSPSNPPPPSNLIWGLPCELQGQLSVRDLCRDLEVMWRIHLLYLRRVRVTWEDNGLVSGLCWPLLDLLLDALIHFHVFISLSLAL